MLDWFHITMRITTMKQMAKGAQRAPPSEPPLQDLADDLDRVKWHLWNDNVFRALQVLSDIQFDLESIDAEGGETKKADKLARAVREFNGYIANNRPFIPNYGERYCYGETISTAFVESTVNEVVSKRMVKKQQMRWTKQGAHLLLQVRIQTLNDDLKDTFGRWYPAMPRPETSVQLVALPPVRHGLNIG